MSRPLLLQIARCPNVGIRARLADVRSGCDKHAMQVSHFPTRAARPLVMAILLAGSLAGCAGIAPNVDLPPPYTEQGVHVEVTGFYRIGYATIVGIAGTATNTTASPLRSCSLQFDVVDQDGAKVCDAFAHTMGLAPGQKWKFQAGFTASFATSFKGIVPGKVTVLR